VNHRRTARIRRQVHGATAIGQPPATLHIAGLEMNLLTRAVTRDGEPIELTAKEFELLEYLLRRRGTVVTREMLARDIWKVSVRAVPLDNVIDVHMTRLRKKIDQGISFPTIQTIRGVGFMLRETAA